MTIERIKEIRNLGRFEGAKPAKHKLRETTIIYAENGSGKTTFSSIFHSLNKQSASYLLTRQTIGAGDKPFIHVQLNNSKPVKFFNGSWDNKPYDVEVFDALFVADNVYAGSQVEHSQKKNLYYFIIGEQGVNLARQIDQIDEETKTINTQIGDLGKKIADRKIGDIEIDRFLKLNVEDDIEEKIKKAEIAFEAQKQADTIAQQSLLSLLNLPNIDRDELSILLKQGLPELSAESERVVTTHIASHLDGNGEDWINKGLKYLVEAEECPFCNQSISSSALIGAYKAYFSKSYEEFKNALSVKISQLEDLFSAQERQRQTDLIQNNVALSGFWNQYAKVDLNPSDLQNRIDRTWTCLSTSLINTLHKKQNAPLEEIILDQEFIDVLEDFNRLQDEVIKYNKAIEESNTLIKAVKKSTQTGNRAQALKNLERLQNVKIRFEKDVLTICESILKLQDEKKKKSKAKRDAKTALKTYEENVLSKYQADINSYLDKSGAGFKIVDTKTQYRGGKASSTYCLQIRGTTVDIKSTVVNEPSFGTILSEGDKSTLAFAFFLTKLKNDSNLADKIVVIDDPISSLDIHRKSVTRDEIAWLIGKCKQLFILSHDAPFLKHLWDKHGVDSEKVTTLEIFKIGEKSEFRDWDIEKSVQDSYFVNCDILKQFLVSPDGDDLRVARALRPVLEGNLHMRFPDLFGSSEMVGSCLKKIRAANQGDPPFDMQRHISEIEAINDYAKDFHHDQTNNPKQTVNRTELEGFVKRTFVFIRGTS